MRTSLDKVAGFCKANKIEINIDKEEIGLWFTACGHDFSIVPIKSSEVEDAIRIIREFRKLKAVPT